MQQGTVKPLALLEAAAKGNGSVNTDIDSSVIRRVPMLFRVAGQDGVFPALSIEALRVAQGASTYLIKSSGASSELSFGAKTGIVAIKTGEIEARTDARGRLALYDSGHRDERFVSARAVLKDEWRRTSSDGHVVFIGTSAIGLKDIRSTPVDDAAPGVEVHAQLAEQMIEHEFLARPDFADGAEFLYLGGHRLAFHLAAAAAVGRPDDDRRGGLHRHRPGRAVARLLGIRPAVRSDLSAGRHWPLIYVSGTALAFMRTERERSAIRGAFGLYLSPDQVERIARHPELLQLGGELREITVMFTDVRGFTRISEQFDPHGLTRLHEPVPHADDRPDPAATAARSTSTWAMRSWRSGMRRSTSIGHAARACDTALAMQARLVDAERGMESRGRGGGRQHIPVNIGIGLNTGPASVGNFGSTQRFTYSCLGDDVNLASRAGRAVQDLRRRHHHRRQDRACRCRTMPRSSSTWSWSRARPNQSASMRWSGGVADGADAGLSRAGAAAGGLPGAVHGSAASPRRSSYDRRPARRRRRPSAGSRATTT